ncbi:MAG TPA: heat-inducible transcriptional repressor HrcA [Alphaproteobacteria bacterium]|nr:heat-inducible transcriptional repressor HrcA [Alphaproteobacteria bacterium]
MSSDLNARSRDIFRRIVDFWLESGMPVPSRALSGLPGLGLSPASIRAVMGDLEAAGLLYAPHISAGRLPTERGLRLYVDGLMEVGNVAPAEREAIDAVCLDRALSPEQALERAGAMISGLSACAGLVVAPKADKALRTLQFVRLDAARLLIVLVFEDGSIENRVTQAPDGLPVGALDAALEAAGNYLSARLAGKFLTAGARDIRDDIAARRTSLDALTQDLVRRGIALSTSGAAGGYLIVRGQSNLLSDVRAVEDLEKARSLLALLEESETAARLLDSAQEAEGVRIFIGTENRIFEHSGWSMVISPCRDARRGIVGAIGVIGPSRLNYGRIIPLVDYTARVLGHMAGGGA